MELLIITGLSGAGKTRTSDVCEDMGYYCIDNLPAVLLPRFAELSTAAGSRYSRVALVPDTSDLAALDSALLQVSRLDCTMRVLYLESDIDTIIRRYKESRRPHPYARHGDSIRAAIEREQQALAPLRKRSDFIMNTAGLSLNKLRAQLRTLLDSEAQPFTVNLLSFGYKHGLPQEADIIVDARCLPNPYYLPELRSLTGLDSDVNDYIFRQDSAQKFLAELKNTFISLLPLYRHDRTEITVAIGCTGGRHRSVAVTQALNEALTDAGFGTAVTHRELDAV